MVEKAVHYHQLSVCGDGTVPGFIICVVIVRGRCGNPVCLFCITFHDLAMDDWKNRICKGSHGLFFVGTSHFPLACPDR